jgi:hypothetical protein
MGRLAEVVWVELCEAEDENTVVARADRYTKEQAVAAYIAQYGIDEERVRYLGIQTIRYRIEEHHVGRLRRCHVVTSERVGQSEWE